MCMASASRTGCRSERWPRCRQTSLQQVTAALREDVGGGDVTASLIDAGHRATRRCHLARRRRAVRASLGRRDVPSARSFASSSPGTLDDGARVARQTRCSATSPGPRARAHRRTHRAELPAAAFRHRDGSAPLRRRRRRHRLHDSRYAQDDSRAAHRAEIRGALRRRRSNHRVGLFDLVLIKENHIATAGSIAAAVAAARRVRAGRHEGRDRSGVAGRAGSGARRGRGHHHARRVLARGHAQAVR